MGAYIWIGFFVLVIGGIGAAFLYGRRAGKDGIRADVASKTADVTAKQAEAQANAPRSKDAIIDRLRNGGGL